MEKPISEKIKEARAFMNLSQSRLAEEVGVTTRSIQAYELGEKKPRLRVLLPLARVLNVSSKYLSDDECTDPSAEIEKDQHLEAAQQSFGVKGAQEVDSLMNACAAFMAGGDITEEQKRKYFEAIQDAYVISRSEAKAKFSPKKNLPVANETNREFESLNSSPNINTNPSAETPTIPVFVYDSKGGDSPQAKHPQKEELIEVVKVGLGETTKRQE